MLRPRKLLGECLCQRVWAGYCQIFFLYPVSIVDSEDLASRSSQIHLQGSKPQNGPKPDPNFSRTDLRAPEELAFQIWHALGSRGKVLFFFIFLWVFCDGRLPTATPKGRSERPSSPTHWRSSQMTTWARLRPPPRQVRPPQKTHKKYFSKATHETARTPKDECLTPPELRERSESVKIRLEPIFRPGRRL